MPHYEFFCHACKKAFSKVLSLVDYEEGEVLCPHCGSKEVEQRWSPFSALTSKRAPEWTAHGGAYALRPIFLRHRPDRRFDLRTRRSH